MADMRMVLFTLPASRAEDARVILEEQAPKRFFRTDQSDDGRVTYQVVLPASRVEPLSDAIENELSSDERFMLVVVPVNALLPERIIKAIEEEEKKEEPEQEEAAGGKVPLRVSRAELRTAIGKSVSIDRAFYASAAIAAIVAAVGLVNGDAAIIIGAMVIAPLLGPHMALALATTLGDVDLGKKALRAIGIGGGLTFGVAVLYALLSPGEFTLNDEITARTEVGFSSVALAAASGCAGAFAFTSGLPATFVGVMVAVALAPPAVASCLLAVNGYVFEAGAAALLFAVNLVCVNLAAILTFRLQGYSPRRWWEKSRANKAVRVSLILWCGTLAALVGLIILFNATASGRRALSEQGSDGAGAVQPCVAGDTGASST
ncbi:MAG: TIGR00341 family protein [Planctomycetota bacterium]